ncbi:MAG TPA: Nif3-like dinuclear metal center hexameric protein [Clostridia bacterium]|jgi:dinuclear metal center YbgI/SA1388 family protein|nr:Nif3-like dinuclear metal center hexameric protein [Clostridia bacterium]
MARLIDVYNAIDSFAPFASQADYDKSGIKLGENDLDVTGILVTLDTTMPVVMEARELGCNVIIEHHPSIWTPLESIDTTIPVNQSLVHAIKFDIAIISAHTNVDFAKGGLGDRVSELMGLTNIYAIEPSCARIGELEKAVALDEYAKTLKAVFNDKYVHTVGDPNKKIKKVALINGGGGADADPVLDSYKQGCDVFVTSDVKHHVARLAKDLNYAIIELSHHATEYPFVALMAAKMKEKLSDVRIFATTVLENPYN